jgi:GPH family glycoside/pentoside/hexuronide:cation symporter
MPERLPRRTKFAYGLGDLGFSLTSTILGAYFAIFLTDVVGVPAGTAAAAIFIGRTWDYINDPIIGHISDRTRTRWGRRRPFLLFGALPLALTFALLWWRPPWDSVLALAVYYALAYLLFDTAATFNYMPYFALTPELTTDYDERTSLTSYRVFFSILGSLIAFTIPLFLVGSFSPENAPRVLTMGALFGFVSALPMLVVFLATRERKEYVDQQQPSLRQSLRAARSNRPFIFSLLMFLMTWVAVDIVQATLLFFVKHVARREPQSDVIMATIFVTGLLALPVWQWASGRWGKRPAFIGGIAFWAVVQIVLITVTPATALAPILILCVLAGVGVSAAHLLPWAIIPDAVEWDEWRTGERHEGMFYSLTSLAQKVASSIAVPLTLLILEITGYVPNAAQQPAGALLGIRIAIGPVPAVLLCVGIAIAFFYPLGRDQHRQIVRELEERRAGRGKEVEVKR